MKWNLRIRWVFFPALSVWNIKNLRKYSILFDIKSSGIILYMCGIWEAYWLSGKAFTISLVFLSFVWKSVATAVGNFNWKIVVYKLEEHFVRLLFAIYLHYDMYRVWHTTRICIATGVFDQHILFIMRCIAYNFNFGVYWINKS